MSIFSGLLTGAGSILGGIGSVLGGNSSGQAQRRAQDDAILNARGQFGYNTGGILGGDYSAIPNYQYQYGQALEHNDPAAAATAAGGINSYINSLGGPVLQQQQNLANAVSARQTGNLGYFDTTTQNLANQSAAQNQNLLNYLTGAQSSLLAGARGAENMAKTWGAGQTQNITRQAGRDLASANQLSNNTLSSRGLGNSSALVNAQRSNQSTINQNRDAALQNQQNAMIDRQLAARGQTLGLQNSTDQNIGNVMLTTGQNATNQAYQRAADRMTLENQNLTRDIALRQDPINTMYQALNSPINNPYSTNLTSTPVANQGSANTLAQLGQGLGAGANYLNNANLLQYLFGGS